MRKHRVLAGILTAIMLLGMVPSALAAGTAEYKGPNPGQITYAEQGVILDKNATELKSGETTLNLTISAPSDQSPVAVEFVLDGTSSLHGISGDTNPVKKMVTDIQNKLSGKLDNVYVGITVFGSKAATVVPMSKLQDAGNFDIDSWATVLRAADFLGTNVQAGLKAGIADLTSATLPAHTRKYMVLITDGGSYYWMNGNEAVNNSYYTGRDNDGTPTTASLMNSDAADGGYTALTSWKNMTVTSAAPTTYGDPDAHEPLAAAVQEIKNDGSKYTNFETGIYWAAQELNNIPDDVNLFTVGKDYYKNQGIDALTNLAGEFVQMAIDMDDTKLSEKLMNKDLSTALDLIVQKISVMVPKDSTVTDYIGRTQKDKGETEDYNFDVITEDGFALRVGETTYTGSRVSENTWTFGDDSRLVYTAGSDEHFVLTLGQDIVRGGKVSLIYNAKLARYDASSGHHDVLTNVEAYLDIIHAAGDKADRCHFPEPSLGYQFGGGGGGGTIIPDDEPPKAELNETNHYAYIIGRKDGLVHPEANITRGEVATIYFRMLTDESRNELWSQSNPYTDVQPDTWCNAAVSTMTRAGVIQGFSDGTFRPYAPITRAQFATIAVRFFEVVYSGDDKFTDIADHWAKDYINKAAEAALINGFSDGTFRPNQNITRAQAMAIFNRVLGRAPEKDHLLPGEMITWPDNMDKNAWYYANMQEATNSHEYRVEYDADGEPYEVWTKLLPVRDWAAFEKEWSTVNSAANPGEVISVPVNVKK
ncbi:MAG: S-layer homology domain-containing protein [Clostridiales bacterium]|nr:S-layer homology domain-containing protein [Clostridiales bacterium]